MIKNINTNNLKGLSLSVFIISLLCACNADNSVSVVEASKSSEQALNIDKSSQYTNADVKKHAINSNVVWAINVGGAQYLGVDGINYQADNLVSNSNNQNRIGEIATIDAIKGSQDSTLFKSYRIGDLAIKHPLDNGSYEIIFKFAEPEDIAIGGRVFDVYAQDKLVIDDLDVRLARDGKHKSSLVRAVNGVEVTDGMLNIHFEALKGQPILSALIVRKKANNGDADSTKWTLVWSDEFNYQGQPDATKWSYDIWPAAKVNEEDQTYTDNLKNVEVKNGNLVITAVKEDYNNAKYTSGRIHSKGKGDFLYGRAEVRAKLPAGQGTWAAIWMLPSDPFKYSTTCKKGEDWQGSPTCNAWPNSGEIDIMEHVGYDMQTIHGTVHNEAYYWAKWEQRKASFEGETVDQAFHTYAVEWTPEHIIVFFDDTPYFFYANELNGWQSWPYDHPYHIILNLAIGGMWGRAGGPIDDSIFPVSMEIDYVRVFSSN